MGWVGRGQTNQGLGSAGGQGSRDCVSTSCLFGEADRKCLVLGWDSPVVGECWGRLGFSNPPELRSRASLLLPKGMTLVKLISSWMLLALSTQWQCSELGKAFVKVGKKHAKEVGQV